MMGDKLVTLAEFENSLSAQFARARLKDDGIKAVIVGQNIKGLLPTDGMLNVELKIFAKDFDRAEEILKSMPNQQEEG